MSPHIRRRQQGLTLIEIMIGLTLSLFMLAGIVQLFVSSKQTYRSNEGLARAQESGRFALEYLANDIRHAGFKGSCTSKVNNLLNPAGTGYDATLFSLDGAIMGWNNSAGTYSASMVNYAANTDVILLKHAATVSGVTASGNTPANANNINLTSASGIPADTILLVADAQGCDIFQNRNAATANSLSRGNSGDPGNLNPGSYNFSHAYDSSMEIMRFSSVLYYIGTRTDGMRSLRSIRYDTATAVEEELVEGILSMQILYGVDTDGDLAADGNYRAAGDVTNWENVVAARVCVVSISAESNVATGNASFDCNGETVTVPAGQVAQMFTTTVGLRNRLP